MNPHLKAPPPPFAAARVAWDLKRTPKMGGRYETFWKDRRPDVIPKEFLNDSKPLWLEVGAGTGAFFESLARLNPDKNLVALERDKMRGKRLERRTRESGLPNFFGSRGNIIPTIIAGIPSDRLERIYILYPCPWPKNAHRKHRWHFHPVMAHLVRALKPGGLLIQASDQEFYIQEAHYVAEKQYGLKTLTNGILKPNEWNSLSEGTPRTKFEKTFLDLNLPCFELISQKL